MKKLFALVLAVAMICAISVSAAKTENLVGHGKGDDTTNTGSYTDGLAEDKAFPESASKGYDVDITASVGTIEHRYAVDIEYDELTFNINGSTLVWNVNTLQYDYIGSNNDDSNKEYNVTVINYSDLPVDLTVKVEDKNTADSADIALSEGVNNTFDARLQDAIGSTISTENGSTVININEDAKKSFQINITSNDWEEVANYYTKHFANNPGATEAIMGTMTITVAKVPSSGT